ncbi:MAG: ABC transporter ATP-binding protein [Gemmatimonadales bacterium]
MNPTDVVVLRDLKKRHGKVVALDGMSLTVPQGSVTGLLGPNGAGKTTALKLLLGMARPDGGTGQVFGHRIDVEADSVRIRQRTGYVSETKELYPHFTVEQMVRLTRGLYPTWRTDLEARLRGTFALRPDARVATLSKGMRSKLSLLLACCRGADLLVLDEPTDGLDPAAAELVLETLIGLVAADGMTVLVSSHHLAEVERVADRVAIVDRGQTRLEAGLDDLRMRVRQVRIVLDADSPAVEGLRSEPGVLAVAQSGRVVTLLVDGSAELVIDRARRFASAASIEVLPATLRDLFLGLTRSGDVA